MKTKTYLLVVLLLVASLTFSQTITLTFTGKFNSFHVPLDSILIENTTQGVDTMLYYPDTVLTLQYSSGINELSGNKFEVESFPNPFKDQTSINVFLPESNNIEITVYNPIGQKVFSYDNYMRRGTHSFTFISGSEGIYFLTVKNKSEVRTIKMICQSSNLEKCNLQYDGLSIKNLPIKQSKSINGFVYNPGDQLVYVGCAGYGQDIIGDIPTVDSDYEFSFVMGLPCPMITSFVYDGQVYKTVQILDQCWMAENLNIGDMIDSLSDQTDNGIIEKYCYRNSMSYCSTFGGLYRWSEMMQYVNDTSTQGICPPDWHIPSDEEWKILEGNVDSQFGYPDPEWDKFDVYRGFDAGANLMERGTLHWEFGNGTNYSGFTVLGGGYYSFNILSFVQLYNGTYFWTSTYKDGLKAWARVFDDASAKVGRNNNFKEYGFYVRCIKN